MDKDTIRETNSFGQQQALDSKKGEAGKAACLKSLELSMLAELAAQVAEVNEHLKCIAHPLLSSEQKTLRDELAMTALQGYIACDKSGTTFWATGPQDEDDEMVDAAKEAYMWADAMLQARKKWEVGDEG